jgi:hypothetical protein
MVVSIRLAVGGAHRSQLLSWAQSPILTPQHAQNTTPYENENRFHF